MNKIDEWFFNHPKIYDLLTVLAPFLFISLIIFCLNSCGAYKEIPVETIERIEYRDSLIYVNDTVTIEIPEEKIVYVGPSDTASILSTSLAHSEAKIEQGILTHTLEQKGQIKTQYDTIIKIQYIDRYIEKEVPVEVIKEVKHIPDWAWYSLIFNIIILCLILFNIYLRFRK